MVGFGRKLWRRCFGLTFWVKFRFARWPIVSVVVVAFGVAIIHVHRRMIATRQKRKRHAFLEMGSKETLRRLMNEEDYGFAPLKGEVLLRERIEDVRGLIDASGALVGKAEKMNPGRLRESYYFVYAMAKYVKSICKDEWDEQTADIFFEGEDFFYMYFAGCLMERGSVGGGCCWSKRG